MVNTKVSYKQIDEVANDILYYMEVIYAAA